MSFNLIMLEYSYSRGRRAMRRVGAVKAPLMLYCSLQTAVCSSKVYLIFYLNINVGGKTE